MEKAKASGIIQNRNLAKIGVMSVPDRSGVASIVLGALCNKNINVQFIVTTTNLDSKSNIILCVSKNDLDVAMMAIEDVKSEINAEKIVYQPNVAMVSVFGPHFRDQAGIAVVAFSALASIDVNIISISTSISTISCIIDEEHINKATEALRIAYNVSPSSIFVASEGLSLRLRGDNNSE